MISKRKINNWLDSQRRGDINRQSNRVYYQLPGGWGFVFEEDENFIEADVDNISS